MRLESITNPQKVVVIITRHKKFSGNGYLAIGMSALLTTCLPYMKDVGDYLDGKGIREKYSVIIGGAATTSEITEEIGANAYGSSAAEGVKKCKMLLGKL